MCRRVLVASLVLLLFFIAARAGRADLDFPEDNAKAIREAEALLDDHKEAIARNDAAGIATSLAALRVLATRLPGDDRVRRSWLEVFTLAYEAARLRDAPEAARALGEDIDVLVASAKEPEAFRLYAGQAFAYAHYELLQLDRRDAALVELDALRALTLEHADHVRLRERLAHSLRTQFRRSNAHARERIRAEVEALAALPGVSARLRESLSWIYMRTAAAHFKAGDVHSGQADLVRLRELVEADQGGGARLPLMAVLAVAYFHLGTKAPYERGQRLLEEARQRIDVPDATEAMRAEFAYMLNTAVWGAHEARQGEGLLALLDEVRVLAGRAESTAKQREHFLRALRGAACHEASQGRGAAAEALRIEARALSHKYSDEEPLREGYAYLLALVVKELANRKDAAQAMRWVGLLAELAAQPAATTAELHAYGSALIRAHVLAEREQPHEKLRLTRLDRLREFADSHAADAHIRLSLARALFNRVLYAGRREDRPAVGESLTRLRALVTAYPDDERVANELIDALAQEHERLSDIDAGHPDALLLRSEMARRIASEEASERARSRYARALKTAHSNLGDAHAWDRADAVLGLLESLAARPESSAGVRAPLLAAYADKVWDIHRAGRPGDAGATLSLARSVHQRPSVSSRERWEFLLVLFRTLGWARAEGHKQEAVAWMDELGSLAESDLLGPKAMDYHVRCRELDIDVLLKAKRLPQAQALLEALALVASRESATAYQRERWGVSLGEVHRTYLEAKEDKSAGRLLAQLYKLVRESPGEGHDESLSLALYNTHWFAMEGDRGWEAEAALAELEWLAAAEGAHPMSVQNLADAHHTHIIADLKQTRLKEARSHLASIRALTQPEEVSEGVLDLFADALYRVHYMAGDEGEYRLLQSLEDELAALVLRPAATWTQKDAYADALADGVWDGGGNDDWEAVDARLAACQALIAQEGVSTASVAHYARALRNAREMGAGREDFEQQDYLGRARELCDAHPLVKGCWTQRAALVRIHGAAAELAKERKRSEGLLEELRSLCRREQASEAERDELAAWLAELVGQRVQGERVADGLSLLSELQVLATRPESTDEQRKHYLSAQGPGAVALLKQGRVKESDQYLAAVQTQAASEGVEVDERKRYAATLRQIIAVRVLREELDAALSMLRRLQALAAGGHDAVSMARMDFVRALVVTAPLAVTQDRRGEMAPFLVALQAMLKAEADGNPLVRTALKSALKRLRKSLVGLPSGGR